MSEADRAAIRCGTLTSGIDLEQIAAARGALEALRQDLPAVQPAKDEPLVSMRVCILAGALIGALTWLLR